MFYQNYLWLAVVFSINSFINVLMIQKSSVVDDRQVTLAVMQVATNLFCLLVMICVYSSVLIMYQRQKVGYNHKVNPLRQSWFRNQDYRIRWYCSAHQFNVD